MRAISHPSHWAVLAAICAAFALALPVMAQEAAKPASPPTPTAPVGLVDQPCAPGTSGRSAEVEALARFLVAGGTIDPALMKRYAQGAGDRAKADEAQQKNDWADLCLYRPANDALIAQGGAKVVFLGDSITELWRLADPDLFTGGIVDRGISGQTSGQALLRFYPDVAALHPKVVHILIGTNDVASNNGPSRPEDLKNNIRALVALAKADHIRVVLGSIPPAATFSWRPQIHPAAQIVELNAWLKAFARQEGAVYVDYYAVLADPKGGMREGYSRDGVHPLDKTYALMKPLALAGIKEAMAKAP